MFVHQLIYCGASDDIAFCGKTNITYKQLQEQVQRYRNYLYSCGVSVGDKVGLFSRNSAEYIYSYMAIASLGAVVVPINFQLSARETAYIIQDADIKHLITMEKIELATELERYSYASQVKQYIISELNEITSKAEFIAAPEIDDNFDDEQPCVIIYTSGTTGNPKGAVLTHKNLISDIKALAEILPVNNHDNILCVLPMYHCFAWTCAVLNPLLCGASITILEAFAPKETLATIKDYKVTIVYGVPPIYNFLSRAGNVEDLSSVKLFISGGASLPEKISEQFYQKYGKHIVEGYGLSEASPVVTLNPLNKTKPCSIGKTLPGIEAKIVNNRGEKMPIGEVGELVVRGPNVMKEYFKLPIDTARTLKDGWLHTGDLAYQDSEGYIFIVDRLKDMIITNGENIYPREIEELLYAYPGITEVAVIGVPDKVRGQAVCAYIVMADGVEFDKKALKEYLHANLAAYKIPREFVLVDALPKNQTGKIMKRILRQQVIEDEVRNNGCVG